MTGRIERASEAAATAPKANVVGPVKPTPLHNSKLPTDASVLDAGIDPEKPSATSGRPSYRAAIDQMCKSCIYDPGSGGGWREQVETCASSNCPLHHVRPLPLTATKTAKNEQKTGSGTTRAPGCELALAAGKTGSDGHIVGERRAA